MAGIYIHIPFCKQACYYCNFHFSTSLKLKNDFVAALLKEIDFRKEYLQNEYVETIYFGGGTPSLLTAGDLQIIFQKLYSAFNISKDAEITLEANPDDINSEKLKAWKKAGINRLSIGIQSFFEEDLIWMNRAHNATQAFDCIDVSQNEGFENITIDLIYGTPGLTDSNWKKNVEQAIAFNIPHLSCYALTVEPKTVLDKMIHEKKSADINPDEQAKQFILLMDWLNSAGYEHYEISNFAKPGMRSKHNSSYWQQKKYLGLGPSAHSFDGASRQWNVANNALYIQSLSKNELLFEKEELTKIQQLNEYIMISLRTIEGCDLNNVRDKFGLKKTEQLLINAETFIQQQKIKNNNEKLILTREGKLLADGIASALFFESN
jgi:putative oxygen-independent coproporphyrinogen III oxidase